MQHNGTLENYPFRVPLRIYKKAPREKLVQNNHKHGFISISDDSRVSKIIYIEGLDMVESCSLCGWRSNLLKSSSGKVIYRWRSLSFDISMIYFPVGLLIWSISYFINYVHFWLKGLLCENLLDIILQLGKRVSQGLELWVQVLWVGVLRWRKFQ